MQVYRELASSMIELTLYLSGFISRNCLMVVLGCSMSSCGVGVLGMGAPASCTLNCGPAKLLAKQRKNRSDRLIFKTIFFKREVDRLCFSF